MNHTEKFLRNVQKDLKRAIDADTHNRKDAVDDLKFLHIQQWSPAELRRRALGNRPALTVNMLPKYVNQLVGDERQNRPRIKILPVDSKADPAIAQIREGLISNIEYNSDASLIYDEAFEMCLKCGYGAWRILTREVEYNPFCQEIYLKLIPNPFMVYLDPDCDSPTYADAEYGFVLDKMSRDEFKRRYPKAEVPTSDNFNINTGIGSEHWYDENLVTVAEYFKKDTRTVTMVQLEDGTIITEDEFNERVENWEKKYDELMMKAAVPQAPPTALGYLQQAPPPVPPQATPQPGAAPAPTPQPDAAPVPPGIAPSPVPQPIIDMEQIGHKPVAAKKAETQETIIRHWVVTSLEILSPAGLKGEVFPGKFIPIVLVTGERTNIEGKTYISSLIRSAKDPQKILNYWVSAAAEMVALAPKAPWLGTAKQFEGYENEYATSNIENHPFLRYNNDPDAPGPPVRNNPSPPPAALFTQISVAESHLKSVIGMFNADVGAGGSEQTGAAVRARQTPGDVGTFRFIDNLSRSIQFSGKVINSMVSEVYDTEQDMRLRHFDNTDSYVPVNTTIGEAIDAFKRHPEKFNRLDGDRLMKDLRKYGPDAKFNDLSIGKYDAIVTIGPSYTTQRQESVASILSLANSMPQQMAMGADILVKNMDFKDAEELSARLRKALPPGLIEPKEGEAPQVGMPPTPAQLVAQAKVQTEQLKVELEKQKLQIEQLKLAVKQADGQRAHEIDKLKLINQIRKQ